MLRHLNATTSKDRNEKSSPYDGAMKRAASFNSTPPLLLAASDFLSPLAIGLYLLIVVLAISLFFIFRLKKQILGLEKSLRAAQIKSQTLTRALSRNALEDKKNYLTQLAKFSALQNDQLLQLQDQLIYLKKGLKETAHKKTINQLLDELETDQQIEDRWVQIRSLFEAAYPDFFGRLRASHPSLPEKDLKLCAFLKMNLSTKEMATLMDISIRGIEASRYRLRKRLKLDKSILLNDYFMNF